MGFWLFILYLLIGFAIGVLFFLKKLNVFEKPRNKQRVEIVKNDQVYELEQKEVVEKNEPVPVVRKTRAEKRELDIRKGDTGEYTINLNISRLGKEYKQMENILLWINNKTTEIDHVVVSPYGIFVIETKNRAGYIYGSERQSKWTQTLNKHTKYQFANPIEQNSYHIKALKQNLPGFEHADYFSIIAFTRRATLKAVPKSKDYSYYVVFNSDVADTIKIKRNNRCLSEEEVEKIYTTLLKRNINDPAIRARHNKSKK